MVPSVKCLILLIVLFFYGWPATGMELADTDRANIKFVID